MYPVRWYWCPTVYYSRVLPFPPQYLGLLQSFNGIMLSSIKLDSKLLLVTLLTSFLTSKLDAPFDRVKLSYIKCAQKIKGAWFVESA